MPYHLNQEQIGLLFPFHIIFDKDFIVLQAGKSIKKIIPSLVNGMKLQDNFQILKPRTVQNKIENLQKVTNNIFVLKITNTDIELKGQMLVLDIPDTFLYVAVPIIRDNTTLNTIGLDMNDFALFDTTGDFLFLLQANKTTLDELHTLSQQLNAQNQELQEATDSLQLNLARLQASEEELRQNSEELIAINDDLDKARNILVMQTQELSAKNDYIVSSINYAKRIQDAILIPLPDFHKILPNSFVFFAPKDILSGDFYWLTSKRSKIIVAAVDCTGHGVPGAFVSLIAENLLDKIIDEHNITEPDWALENLHQGMCRMLHQEHTNNNDSLDIALCVIDRKNKLLEYSGAKSPLFLIQDDTLTVIKGDKHSVGGLNGIVTERSFTKHVISLQTPTTFFIASDGYEDQFGGADNKKFLVKNFRKLLKNIYKENAQEQKRILSDTFFKWRGDQSQTDDVLVIGVQLEAM